MNCEARPRRERNELLREIEMAVDMFLKLSGIRGESVAAGHREDIDVLSWSWNLSNKITFVTGGLGSGKAQAGELNFVHWVDCASPELMKYCAEGKHIPTGTLTLRKAGGKVALEYLKFDLKEIFITSVQDGTSAGEEHSMESVALFFTQIEVTYRPQASTGTTGGSVKFGWNLRTTEVY
jgi:type VI secretion system secreted protein Hcp